MDMLNRRLVFFPKPNHQSTCLAAFFLSVVLLLLFFSNVANAAPIKEKISVVEAHQLSSENKVLLIDIRSEQEWRETGVAPQAHTISMHQQGGLEAFTQDILTLANGDKNRPIALICAGGVRSNRMQRYLRQQGFTQVSDVLEGMIGGWVSRGWIDQKLPMVSYPK